MPKPTKPATKRVTSVREHPRRVPPSRKNPQGSVAIVDRHPRRITGPSLTAEELKAIAAGYNREGLSYPTPDPLKAEDGNAYDELIAIWTDYFNRQLVKPPEAPLDPDVIKALIGSESDFKSDPPGNRKAIGIGQITRETLKALIDPDGEAKELVFKGIRQKDLKDPSICIPLATRWLFRKRAVARSKLGRPPTNEELILEYKGLLKSKTQYKESALAKYRYNYGLLKKK